VETTDRQAVSLSVQINEESGFVSC